MVSNKVTVKIVNFLVTRIISNMTKTDVISAKVKVPKIQMKSNPFSLQS